MLKRRNNLESASFFRFNLMLTTPVALRFYENAQVFHFFQKIKRHRISVLRCAKV